MEVFNVTVDYVFTKIFCPESNSELVISFLNSILKYENYIINVRKKEKSKMSNIYSRVDLEAITSDKKILDININLIDKYEYRLNRDLNNRIIIEDTNKNSIIIRVLTFNVFMDNIVIRKSFDNTNCKCELYDIEINKVLKHNDEKDMLNAWIEFIRNPISLKTREYEFKFKEIRRAVDIIMKMSNDKNEQYIYKCRVDSYRRKLAQLG